MAIWATLDIYNVEQCNNIGTCLNTALVSLQGSPINNKVSLPDTAKFSFLNDNYQVPCDGYACESASKVSRIQFTMSVPGHDWIPGAAARLARVVNNGQLAANLSSACGYPIGSVFIPSGGLYLYNPPPTSMPTPVPSVSFTPTYLPSSQPSNRPSNEPSSQPSNIPSVQPSALPSAEPSAQPSMQVRQSTVNTSMLLLLFSRKYLLHFINICSSPSLF